MIYLDYAASSQKHFDIFKETIEEFENIYANPSSNHSLGKKNKILLENSRKKIAESLGAESHEIIFLSGGTEANNTVFNHVANKFKTGTILISEIEHSSTTKSAEILEKKGFKIIKIKVTKDGIIDIDDLKNKISNNIVLVSIMFANNETGVIQPVEEIGDLCLKNNVLFHCDIVQAYAKTEIDVKKFNIDYASVSAHKIGATNNFGFLYSKNLNITRFIVGGKQENELRSGSVDVISAVILEKCLDRTIKSVPYLKELKFYFIEKLKTEKINFEINGDINNSLPNILNIYFPNLEAQRLITYLDINGIYISGGSACNSGNIKGSEIIKAMFDEKRAENSVRISLGFKTTKEMIDFTVEKIKNLEKKIIER